MLTEIKELEELLQWKEFKMASILEISAAVNNTGSVEKSLKLFDFILSEQLRFKKYSLIYKFDSGDVLLKQGVKRKFNLERLIPDLERFENTTIIQSSKNVDLEEFDTVVPISYIEENIAYLLLGNTSKKVEYDFLSTLANIIVVALENKRLTDEKAKQKTFNKELEIASELQKELLPSKLPSNKEVDIGAKFLSHHQVGGDYFDFIQLNEEEFMVCIADVSGKGVSAALMMANFQATVRTMLREKRVPLKKLVIELNDVVNEHAKGEKFITFFIAEYNTRTREFRYINAGHNYPILTNGKDAVLLDKGSVGLGMLKELPFVEVEEMEFPPNVTLCMYTDGVVELENEKEQAFETENLARIINRYYPLKMDDLNSIIFSKLDEWRGKKNYIDDTAVVTCRIF